MIIAEHRCVFYVMHQSFVTTTPPPPPPGVNFDQDVNFFFQDGRLPKMIIAEHRCVCYVMHQSFVTTTPPPYGDSRGIVGLMRVIFLLSSPAVPGKCKACYTTQTYLSEKFMFIKSGAITLSRSPQCRAFSRAVKSGKS